MISAMIVGLSGPELSTNERAFLSETAPAGIILFARNIKHSAQISALVAEARSAIGRDDVLVAIDQEGGRVQRIRAPLAHDLPPAASLARLYERDCNAGIEAARLLAALCGSELAVFGINMNCAPVLDTPVDGAHDIIGDRAYGRDPAQIVALAAAVAEGLMQSGVVPVIKHIPGHGRATADSHFALPTVDTPHAELSKTDFAPFRALAHLPAAMTAHVIFSAIDAREPASTSARLTNETIRKEIGFDGMLMSDDLSMRALSGPMTDRAKAVLAAGSDIALHCNGDAGEMAAVAAGVGALAGASLRRFQACFTATERRQPVAMDAAREQLAALMDGATPRV